MATLVGGAIKKLSHGEFFVIFIWIDSFSVFASRDPGVSLGFSINPGVSPGSRNAWNPGVEPQGSRKPGVNPGVEVLRCKPPAAGAHQSSSVDGGFFCGVSLR